MRQTIVVMVLAIAATTVKGQTTVTQSSSAPTANVVISQTDANTGAGQGAPWRDPGGSKRDVGQTFPGGFTLDKITVRIFALAGTGYDGEGYSLKINTYTDATDVTPDSTVVTETGSLPATMKSAFDGGSIYLTFDIPDLVLSGGQQYGFFLEHTSGNADNMLMSAKTDSTYTDGIGLEEGPSAMDFWDGSATRPADLAFWLEEPPGPPPATPGTLIYGK